MGQRPYNDHCIEAALIFIGDLKTHRNYNWALHQEWSRFVHAKVDINRCKYGLNRLNVVVSKREHKPRLNGRNKS